MGEEQFFVGINNHLDIRRNLLECSREMIQSMQSYEKLTRIRDIKIKRIKQLRTVIRETDLLITKLQEELPKTNLSAGIIEPAKRIKINSSPKVNEINKLEEQLKDIESEINRLS